MEWKKKWTKYINIILMTLFVIFWLILFILYNPNEIIKNLGIEQIYLTLFFLGVLGALTSLTSVSIYPAIATFVIGGGKSLFCLDNIRYWSNNR